ncbi:barstar family protein [Sulfuriroseicoccus oceanibius]|uniref:Barstar family protein n=1 Tax=Sulfuriroseicoccus oceanibius TaxID=2707525 RepID=A0A6B3LE87_9BACT|nr:barstar family protein [Sulfuriroseicoccus oceanibius]QQL44424.1 barstar family protein [Sulfuriroseicoccus oceanibius]
MPVSRAVKIQLEGVSSKEELHERLAHALAFPDYYGRNWDAFWDCITELAFDDVSEVTLTDWDGFPASLTDDAAKLLRCLNEWTHEMPGDARPSLFIETGGRRVELPDTISTPSFTTLVTKDILFSDDFLRRGVIALRDDQNYEVRIERWEYHDDPISYPSRYGYWSEIGKPSLTDSLELGRQLSIDHGCKNKG